MYLRLPLWTYLFVGVLGAVTEAQDGSRVVTTDQGPVRGRKIDQTDIYGFFGIPYATEPTGNNKFKAPLPPPTWNDTFEANNQIIACPQSTTLPRNDNCLVINIYVPETNRTELPVMVLVHGGGFQTGAAYIGSPLNFIQSSEFILVTFNYRLSVYGFLCLGNEDAPGNAGMKDQVAALRWINRNIRQFGGSPNDVTLNGCSAGGVAVDLLRIVNVTDGLFNKVITGSGASLGPFSVQIDPIENAKIYARELGFSNVNDITALTEFYKNATHDMLMSQANSIINRPDGSVLFIPCVERDIGVERFLVDAPFNLIKSGMNKALPVLYGVADKEGLLFLPEFAKWQTMMNENFVQFIPADLKIDNNEEREAVANQIKEFYFGNQPVTNASYLAIIDYFSDIVFVYSMLKSVKLHAEASNNSEFYLYEYSVIHPSFSKPGADHCDQYIVMFDENDSSLPQGYRNIKAIMNKVYTDFITTGNPVPQGSVLPPWPPANATRDPHMAIGSIISLEGPLYQKRAEFWDQLYEKYYRAPGPPRNNAASSAIAAWTVFLGFVLKIVKLC